MGSSVPSRPDATTLGAIAVDRGRGAVDGPFGSNLPASDYADSGVPVIRGSNLTSGTERFRGDDFVYVSDATADRLSRCVCIVDDIVFTKKGTLGQVGIVPPSGRFKRFLLSSNQMRLRVDTAVADPLYVYYYMSSPQSRAKIIRDSEATGVPKINLSYLRSYPIALPTLDEQRSIASVLGALDDKIDLNRRMSRTLNEMAQTIFRARFVRHPGSVLPAGWIRALVSDVVELRMDRIKAGVDGLPYVPLECLASKSLALAEFRPGREARSSLTRFYRGDVLFGAYRPYFHKVNVMPFDGVTRTTAFVLKPRHVADAAYVALLLFQPETVEYATTHAQGTTIPYATWEGSLASMPVLVPPDADRAAFQGVAWPTISRMSALASETRRLQATRDALLPALVSGKVTVDAIGQENEPGLGAVGAESGRKGPQT